jgi:hypothetical protein
MNLKWGLLAIPVVLIVSVLFWSSRTWGFKGDGRMTDHGPFRPSYEVKMPGIPLDQSGEYEYSFRGLPSEDDMGLRLYLTGKTNRNREELVGLRTWIDASVRDGSKGLLCSASGTLEASPFPPGKNWVLSTGPDDAVFWNSKCNSVKTHPKQFYLLSIRIRDVDPRSPKATLVPTIEGGGIELP